MVFIENHVVMKTVLKEAPVLFPFQDRLHIYNVANNILETFKCVKQSSPTYIFIAKKRKHISPPNFA